MEPIEEGERQRTMPVIPESPLSHRTDVSTSNFLTVDFQANQVGIISSTLCTTRWDTAIAEWLEHYGIVR